MPLPATTHAAGSLPSAQAGRLPGLPQLIAVIIIASLVPVGVELLRARREGRDSA